MASSRSERRRLAPLLESGVMVGLMMALNALFFRADPGFAHLEPHPTLFIALFVLARYGFTAGLSAAAIASVGYLLLVLLMVDLPSFYHLLGAPWSTPVVVLLPTTIVLGMVIDRHLERLRAATGKQAELAEEAARLSEELAKLRDVNVDLAGKVVGADATFQRLYRYAKALNVNDVLAIYNGLLAMLVEVLGTQVVSVWEPAGAELVLRVRRGPGEEVPAFRLDSVVNAYFDAHGVLSLHDVPERDRHPGLPFLVGRVCSGRGGPVVAYLTVDKLPFARYNAETIRFFALAVDWASNSVGSAQKLQQLSPDRRAEMESRALTAVRNPLDPSATQVVRTRSRAHEPAASPPSPPPTAAAVPSFRVLLDEVERYLNGDAER
jgi:hypothetical protein